MATPTIRATTVTALTASDATIVSAGSSGDRRRIFLIIGNNDSSPRTVRIHVRTSGGAVDRTTAVAGLYDKTLAANEAVSVDFYLTDTQLVSGLASATNVVTVIASEIKS